MKMDRRQILIHCAGGLAAAAFHSSCATTKGVRIQERQDDVFLKILAAGMMAPNPHNTQAWRIKLLSAHAADLLIDNTRLLPHIDPYGRQIHIGAGCFIEACSIAARAYGYILGVQYNPAGAPDSLARLDISSRSFAVTEGYALLRSRRTSRVPYSLKPIPSSDQSEIAAAGDGPGVSLRWLPESLHPELKSLSFQAMAIENHKRLAQEETLKWFRFNRSEWTEKGDGLAVFSSVSGLEAWIASRFYVTRESWFDKATVDLTLQHFKEQVDQTPHFIALTSQGNDQRAWLEAGRSYLRCELEAQKRGYRLAPLSQILQEYADMSPVFGAFHHLIQIQGGERVQMFFRVGIPEKSLGDFSPRRRLANLILG